MSPQIEALVIQILQAALTALESYLSSRQQST